MVEWVAGTGHAMRADMDGRTIRGAARARFHRLSRVGWLVAGAACLAASPAGAAAAADSCPILHDQSPRPDTRFASIDSTVRGGVGTLYPGAVLLIAHHGAIVHRVAFGNAQTLTSTPEGDLRPLSPPRPMTVDTPFDMASITKVEATTAAMLHLVGRGQVSLDDRLGTLLPAFRNTDKAGITVRQLLTHRSGVWEWQPTWLHRVPSGGALPYLAALPLRYPIGARFAYSDLGFMILGAVVAKVSGIPLDRYVREQIYRPLGMTGTGFLPDAGQRRGDVAGGCVPAPDGGNG